MLVEKKDTKQVYAIKSLRKEDIIEKNQIEHTKTERFVLEKVITYYIISDYQSFYRAIAHSWYLSNMLFKT